MRTLHVDTERTWRGGEQQALYLATQTDRRVFVADPGNDRIISVKLGYHATEKV